MDWYKNVSYKHDEKEAFHREAKKSLRQLAKALDLAVGTYDIRSNKGGIAVSGEITLHGENIYVQVSQSCMGNKNGILIRKCRGRKDYTGMRNNFADLALLDNIPALARTVKAVQSEALFHTV